MILSVFIDGDGTQWSNHALDLIIVCPVGVNSVLCIAAELCVVSYFLQLAKIATRRNLQYGMNLAACDALQYADIKQVSVVKPHTGTMWNHSLPPPPYSSRTGATSIAKQPIHDAYSYGCTSSSRGSYNEKH